MEQENEHFNLRYSSLSHHSRLSVEDFQIITVISNIFQQNKFAPLLFYNREVLGATRVNTVLQSLSVFHPATSYPESLLSRGDKVTKTLIFLQNNLNGTRNIQTASGKVTSGAAANTGSKSYVLRHIRLRSKARISILRG